MNTKKTDDGRDRIELPSKRCGKTLAAGKVGNRNAKRGRALEDVIGPMFGRVRDADIQKTTAPTRIVRTIPAGAFGRTRFEVIFEQKGFCDYSGWYRGIHVEIEAKRFGETEGTWNFKSAIKPHQVDRLEACRAAGGLAGVILATDGDARIFGIPWEVIAAAIARGRKSFTVPDLEQAVGLPAIADRLPGVLYPIADIRGDGMEGFLSDLKARRVLP
jgi:penicillin-binding protein-related factor A (putative recombinase)